MLENQDNISRRTLVKTGGAIGAVALVGGAMTAASGIVTPQQAIAATEGSGSGAAVQNAIFFDQEACIGCQTCSATCRATYNLEKAYRSVYFYSAEIDGKKIDYSVSVGCCFCDNPACMNVCPTGAMHRTDDLGHVVVEPSKCIGCGYCAMACPYGVPRVDREVGHSVKCDGCYEKVKAGDQPACVKSCPMEALSFGTVEEMAKLGERANIAPLPAPHFTEPNMYISASSDAPPAGTTEGEITNLGEMI